MKFALPLFALVIGAHAETLDLTHRQKMGGAHRHIEDVHGKLYPTSLPADGE